MSEQTTITSTDLIISQVISAWAAQNKTVTDFFNKQPDEAYLQPVAPGRNRAIYLLGHIIAANDMMLPMFFLGDSLYPELVADFLDTPDNPDTVMPSVAELKEKWTTLNTTLAGHFANMDAASWLARHNRVSPEDFAKEPHRNKLNVLINRTNHQTGHAGQLALMRF